MSKEKNITNTLVKLEEKAKLLPTKSGCYLMKNKNDQIIYVGKAKNLKARVLSYFNLSAKNPKTEILVSHIVDFDFIMTDTDAEAFVLENNLIKKHAPKYNIRLKDDKSYPYVVINHGEPFARLEYIRKVKRSSKLEVFGPFVTGSNVGEVLRVLTKVLNLRDCSLTEFKKRKEPCLLFQMKQCSAPCVGKISEENYAKDLSLAIDLFKSSGKKVQKYFEQNMFEASEAEEFERAASLRDNLGLLNNFITHFRQENAEMNDVKNVDVVAFYQGEEEVDISIYMVRNGLLLGHKNFSFSNLDLTEEVEDEVLNFLFQYYAETFDLLPDVIITQFSNDVNEEFETALKNVQEKIQVKSPGNKYQSLLDLTRDHAFEQQRVRLLNQESVYVGLNKLKDLLGLRERPVILECYDIAIFQGKSPTAAQIVFHDGKADKKAYRHYTLQERPEGNNDFAMMKELITRRLDNGKLPDVFIVDGGLGQVNVFREVLKEFNIPIPVVGIAKSKVLKGKESFKQVEIKRSEERLIIPERKNPYFLNQNKSLFKIIIQMRDEAHRFSRRLHHHHETKRVLGKKQKLSLN
ncbi:MAG: excinuclease ABC subunit UvrC [Bacteriovoracaceae bacterium]|nr:excinuclease ABC subunit UvrC [Bacteriovoracaceae bacterium]